MNPIVLPIKGYEGKYDVTSDGEVLSYSIYKGKNKVMAPRLHTQGYSRVNLYSAPKVCKDAFVHRLVAEAFLPKPSGMDVVNHLDGNKTNNNVTNLEWTDLKGNSDHAIVNGLWKNPKGGTHHWASISDEKIINIRHCRGAATQKVVAKAFGVSKAYVGLLWRGERRTSTYA